MSQQTIIHVHQTLTLAGHYRRVQLFLQQGDKAQITAGGLTRLLHSAQHMMQKNVDHMHRMYMKPSNHRKATDSS
jgi:hypothetical protein